MGVVSNRLRLPRVMLSSILPSGSGGQPDRATKRGGVYKPVVRG
jgi:hypothetical protein